MTTNASGTMPGSEEARSATRAGEGRFWSALKLDVLAVILLPLACFGADRHFSLGIGGLELWTTAGLTNIAFLLSLRPPRDRNWRPILAGALLAAGAVAGLVGAVLFLPAILGVVLLPVAPSLGLLALLGLTPLLTAVRLWRRSRAIAAAADRNVGLQTLGGFVLLLPGILLFVDERQGNVARRTDLMSGDPARIVRALSPEHAYNLRDGLLRPDGLHRLACLNLDQLPRGDAAVDAAVRRVLPPGSVVSLLEDSCDAVLD